MRDVRQTLTISSIKGGLTTKEKCCYNQELNWQRLEDEKGKKQADQEGHSSYYEFLLALLGKRAIIVIYVPTYYQ